MAFRHATTVVLGVVLGALALSACLFPSLGALSANDASVEAGGDADAGADAGGEASPGSYCASLTPQPLFCADFDEGSATAGWDSTDLNLATVSLSTTQFSSAPAALRASAPNVTTTDWVLGAVKKTFASPIGNAVLAFDLDIDTMDTSVHYTKFVALSFDGNDPPYILYAQITDSTSLGAAYQVPTADGGATYGDYGSTTLPPLGTWAHVEIDLFKSATDDTTESAVIFLDGKVAVPTFTLGSPAAFGNLTVEIGIAGLNAPTKPWTFLVDNVTFDER
jgi:hypothetical protein